MKKTLASIILLAINFNNFAQSTRTWISGVGDDANPCSRTAPCKTFAGAIIKTAAGGEISVLDPGGYGSVTITKSITINGEGTLAGITNPGTNAIVINAAATDKIILRHITMEGNSTGVRGINIINAGNVLIENCTISDNNAINAVGISSITNDVQLTLKNVTISNCITGVELKSTVTNPAFANFENVTITKTTTGLHIQENAKALLINSKVDFNTNGIVALNGGIISVESSSISFNATAGIESDGAASIVRLSNVNILGNTKGVKTSNSGKLISYGNNKLAENGSNDPLGVISTQ